MKTESPHTIKQDIRMCSIIHEIIETTCLFFNIK
jgi:hypothetical protein